MGPQKEMKTQRKQSCICKLDFMKCGSLWKNMTGEGVLGNYTELC